MTEEGLKWARDNLKPRDEVFTKAIGDRWPRVRKWHPWCVRSYMLRNNPGRTRHYVWMRDRGKCVIENCVSGSWQADHIVPLIDGGSFEMSNLQTLCRRHHNLKTAREAGERASRRKQERATG